jgi:hypothetical protein
MRKARVFISCGQRNAREKRIGFRVFDHFNRRGFSPFFAERVHSPESLTEHIFKTLCESEYFLFIDFRRERIGCRKTRGSLFVGQEIAIATYLKIPGVGFCEKGMQREGILDYQIYNPIVFSNEEQIFGQLEKLTREWDANSVNELFLSYDPDNVSRDYILRNHPHSARSDWWHIQVHNRHKSKHALSCLAYLSHIEDLGTQNPIDIPSIELNWSGLGVISVNILSNQKRELDAFFTIHGEDKIRFHTRKIHTSNPRYQMAVLDKGHYKLRYLVAADNFPLADKTFQLDFEDTIQSIRFYPLDTNH